MSTLSGTGPEWIASAFATGFVGQSRLLPPAPASLTTIMGEVRSSTRGQPAGAAMSLADYIVTLSTGALIGALLGPPLGYWSLHWQHRVRRHREHCSWCRQSTLCRAARRA